MRARRLPAALVVLALLGLGLDATAGTEAALSGTTSAVTALSSAADWLPPTVERAVVVKSEGGLTGSIRQGGSYRVHASVVDDASSRPASGVATVTAGITGLPPMNLSVGGATIEGLTYTHQTPVRTEAYAPANTYDAWIRAVDRAVPANTTAELPLQVVVDNTAPAGSLVTITNGNGTSHRPDPGDQVTVTWNEVVDPDSVVDDWTGGAMNVTVRITDGTGGDVLTVWNAANTVQLPLGQVALGGDYVTATTTFGASGTRSRLGWTTARTGFTVVLGTASPSNTTFTSSTATTVTWAPTVTGIPSVFDRAGNRSSTTAVVETGTADREF